MIQEMDCSNFYGITVIESLATTVSKLMLNVVVIPLHSASTVPKINSTVSEIDYMEKLYSKVIFSM